MALTSHTAAPRPEQPEKRSLAATAMFALLFIAWVGEWPIEVDSVLYSGRWRSPFAVFGPLFTPVPGINLFPWQLLLIALVPVCLAARGAHEVFEIRSINTSSSRLALLRSAA